MSHANLLNRCPNSGARRTTLPRRQASGAEVQRIGPTRCSARTGGWRSLVWISSGLVLDARQMRWTTGQTPIWEWCVPGAAQLVTAHAVDLPQRPFRAVGWIANIPQQIGQDSLVQNSVRSRGHCVGNVMLPKEIRERKRIRLLFTLGSMGQIWRRRRIFLRSAR